MKKVHCKGCSGLILLATAKKYYGYSRQCLAKKHKKTELLGSGPIEQKKVSPSNADILFFLQKTKVTFPKIYYYKEFVKVWALSGSPDFALNRYKLYLQKIQKHINTLTEQITLPELVPRLTIIA